MAIKLKTDFEICHFSYWLIIGVLATEEVSPGQSNRVEEVSPGHGNRVVGHSTQSQPRVLATEVESCLPFSMDNGQGLITHRVAPASVVKPWQSNVFPR